MNVLEQEMMSAVKHYCRKKTLRTYSFTAETPKDIDNTIDAFLKEEHCMVDIKMARMDLGLMVTVLYE